MDYTREYFLELSRGDESAADFCLAFLRDAHLDDDFVDGDVPVSAEALVQIRLGFLTHITYNPFWLSFGTQLMPLIIQGAAAFSDATDWAKRVSLQDRRAADVLKAYYGEVLWHVAFICGGWNHMREMQRKFREFNYDAPG